MDQDRIEKKIHTFFNGYKSLLYKKNDIILAAGHNPQYLFYIIKGIVNDYLINSAGTSFTINLLQVNDFFPFFIFDDAINTYYFQAYSPVEVKRIPKKDFMTFLEKEPEIMMYVMKKLVSAIAVIHDRLEHFLMSDSIEERLQYLVLQLARQFGIKEGEKIIIPMHLTHNDLASYIGATRESVTRCLTALVKKGIIQVEKERIIAKDLLSLEQKF